MMTTAPAQRSSSSMDATQAAALDVALNENVQEIKLWEQSSLRARSRSEQVGDWIARTAASGPVLFGHFLWFTGWIVVNLRWVPSVRPFDPFPFAFLTMIVSLEAIFLALFVLASQNRLARQADKRSHLDLQIDLLAEREMTAVLQILGEIAGHLGVESSSVTAAQLQDLAHKTDINNLTRRMEELSEQPRTGG